MSDYIYLIVGASGSGKSTISRILQNDYGMKAVQSYTTRPPRCSNEEGHIFISDEAFNSLTPVAFTQIGKYRYCATARQLDMNDIYVIDPEGVYSLERCYEGSKTPIVFYIDAPRKVRRERMMKRGDPLLDIKFRLRNDRRPFAKFKRKAARLLLTYQSFVIDNSSNDINEAVAEVLNIIGSLNTSQATMEEE